MISDKVARLHGKENQSPEKIFAGILYLLCSKFKWDYETVMNQPIPFVNMLLHEYELDMKKQIEASKKKGRR